MRALPIVQLVGWIVGGMGWHLADEGTIDGVQYVTVLNAGDDPIEYNIPESEATERYGLTLARHRWDPAA